MTTEQEDVYEAAKLAHQSKNFFSQQYVGTSQRSLNGMHPSTIVDPRHILQRDFRGNGGHPQNFNPQQYPPQQPFYQNPGQQQYPDNGSGIIAYGQNIPENISATAPALLRVPIGRDANGEIIYGDPNTVLGSTPGSPQQHGSDGLQTTGFQLPQFGATIPNKVTTNVIDEEKFELLIKEIKSMKKSINKLTKAFEMYKSSMSTAEPILTEDSLENTDQS